MSTCYLWLNKNQRDATLKASPYLVAYGLVLLVLEWIWCLNLLPTELPQLTQIGLIKHNQLPLPHLLSKIFFVTVLWLTMKMYLDEKRSEVEKMQRSLVASALDPKLLTLKRIESGQNIAEMVQPPSMSHASENILEANPFLGKFLDFVKRWIVKVWIWIVVGMLFVIGTGDVVLYRILYMAIFLIFTVTFILSYHAWRRLLYRFWIAVIVYSMVILVLVYIYQFENFPQIIEEKLSIPIQLQKDFGLEVYSPVELLGSLLTPSFFLIITIIQVYYFHDEFLMLSEIDTRSTVAANFSMAFGNIFQMGSSHLLINDDELSSEDSNLEKEDVSTKLGQEKPTLLEFFTFEELKDFLPADTTDIKQAGPSIQKAIEEPRTTDKEQVGKSWPGSYVDKENPHTCSDWGEDAIVTLLHLPLVGLLVCYCMMDPASFKVSSITAIYVAFLVLAKMIYQIKYIDHNYYDKDCN
ncbi:hypothetical protein QYM36_002255, partial [Artemia franciscana]